MSQALRRILLFSVPFLVLAGALYLRITGAHGIYPAVQAQIFAAYARLPLLSPAIATRPLWADQAELLFVGVTGLVMVFLIGWEQFGKAALIALAAMAGAGLFAYRALVNQHLLFDIGYPALAFAAIYAGGALARLISGGGERERMRRSLATHLPAGAMAQITRQPGLLNLAGETRTMTHLVCGIRGFSQWADSFAGDPESLARLTRRAMEPMAQAVLDRHGAVDRLLPGGLSAFFNAPFDDPEHAVHACECALRMTEALEKVNLLLEQERRADGSAIPAVELGIGIATGLGIAGDFGTPARPEYTVAGGAARLAAEIERLSRRYGPAIIVSDSTRALAERNFAFLEVDLIASEGHGEPMPLYALLGNPLFRASPKFRALQTFHEHIFQAYRAQEWTKTRALIQQCRALSGASPALYDLYLARIAWYENNPPGEGWNGVVRQPLQ